MLVENLASQLQDLDALLVRHVHSFSVGALNDKTLNVGLGQTGQMSRDGIEIK